MKKKIISVTVILTLFFSTVFSSSALAATSLKKNSWISEFKNRLRIEYVKYKLIKESLQESKDANVNNNENNIYSFKKKDNDYNDTGSGSSINQGNSSNSGLRNGAKMSTNTVLDKAGEFLGNGYSYAGDGRFVSNDGTRQVRMGDGDILGGHGGGPHVNFEYLAPNPAKPGKMNITKNIHIYLED